MNAIILNGCLKNSENLSELQHIAEQNLKEKGYEVETVVLHEKKIAACMGCFHCWVKTPGICVIDDYGRELSEKLINCDLFVYVTPVTFGGYSSELKKAVDRIIPLMLPFFMNRQGEIHHMPRYKSYPKVMVLGVMKEENKEMEQIFHEVVKRNEKNWFNSFKGIVLQAGEIDDAGRILDEAMMEGGEAVC